MPLPSSFLFSQSNLQDYVDCPRRFYLKHLLKLAWPSIESEPVQENEHFRLQGERFHKMVHQLVIGIPVEKISSMNADIVLASWWENFLASQKDLLTNQTSRLFPEFTLSTLHAGYRLLAKYDLLQSSEDSTFVIYDWKTYRNRPRRERLAAKLQTRLYPFILSASPIASPNKPGNLKLIYWYANFPSQPEIFTYSATQHQQDSQYLEALILSIEKAAREESEDAFPLTMHSDRCLFCVYRSLCDRGTRAGDGMEGEEADFTSSLDDFDFEQISEVEFLMAYQRHWRPYPEAPVSPELHALAEGYPLIAQYFTRRGLRTAQDVRAYLDPDQYSPTPPSALPGMALAVERLQRAVFSGERICVWGDFDVDGQTATTILVSTLRQLGAQVRYHIPVRDVESHGIRLSILQKEIDSGLDLLLTCDTGIAANQAIQAAAAQGIQTIITDHHSLPAELPPAFAIVSPRLLEDSAHPLAALPGVGVAYKLVEALFDIFGKPRASQEYLDLVALGIVADVASLVGDTRYLLQLGLRQLQNPTRPALQALLEIAGIKPGSLNEETIAFALAPRLNAVGRLSDANPMVEFFTTSHDSKARIQAQVIEGLNAHRKLLTDQVFKAAMSQVERDPALLETSALVLSYPTWPAGVIGIIASRLVEYFHKPVVLLSTPPGETARGSARSVPGLDITQAIASQAGLLLGYGGHPMAAGLSLQPERIPEFRQGLSQALDQQIAERADRAEEESALFFDALYPFASLSLEFVEQLEQLAPFGPGNPAPILVAQNVTIDSVQAVGLHDEHLLVRLLDPAHTLQEVVWWQAGSLSTAPGFTLPEGPFDLAFTVHSHDFKGQRSIQVEWLDYRFVPQTGVSIQAQAVTREWVDCRDIASPLNKLQELLSQAALQVWQEGPTPAPISGSDRFHLSPHPILAIWTIPPGRSELAAAIERVQPQTIYIFGNHPGLNQLAPFLERLSGLVKFALRRPSQPVEIAKLAVALAHQLTTIGLGLSWLEAKGIITCEPIDAEKMLLHPGPGKASPKLEQVEASLRQALEETEAFRKFYLRQSLDKLV